MNLKLRNEQPADRISQLPLSLLVPFQGHPFSVADDGEMQQLIISIRENGILVPLIVRPSGPDKYEIISGHRRCFAAGRLGLTRVPAIVKIIGDEDAVISMVDANLQREHIAPSEKAFAYRMKYEALKAKRSRKSGPLQGPDAENRGLRTVELIGREAGESPRQVQRYIKITELIPELLHRLDAGGLSFNPAVEIACLSREDQYLVADAMDYTQAVPSLSQAIRIKQLGQKQALGKDILYSILEEVKQGETERVSFKTGQLRRFFPRGYSSAQMRREIFMILSERTGNTQNRNGGISRISERKRKNQEMLTPAEAAAFAGISIWQFDQLCKRKDFPLQRVGQIRRVNREAFIKWLDENSRKGENSHGSD